MPNRVLRRSTIHRAASLLLIALLGSISGCGANDPTVSGSADGSHERGSSGVRVMSWNVKRNSILSPNGIRHESFARIVRAVDPDVIALQEVLRPDLVEQLSKLMSSLIPLEDGGSWHVHTVSDNVLISRYAMRWQGGELAVPYPLPQFGLPDFHLGFAAALLELPEFVGDTDMLVISMHNKSGAGEDDVRLRQVHADTMVRWMRDVRDPTRGHSIVDRTPVVILGDMNVVPDASMAPLETLIRGDIADEDTFGPDFSIDWDGSDMTDARPSHNGLGREYYTWRDDQTPFPPSALDRVLYTDSVMSVQHRFVLNTMTLSPDELTKLGLQRSDVLYDDNSGIYSYDHLPLIVDFEIAPASSEQVPEPTQAGSRSWPR